MHRFLGKPLSEAKLKDARQPKEKKRKVVVVSDEEDEESSSLDW